MNRVLGTANPSLPKTPVSSAPSAAGGEWRLAFAFDPERRAILLVAGDKSGGSARRFYRTLIARADARFDQHLARIANEGGL